ncbi:hypothetical protein C5167_007542, partial [Papaver somniferum]
KEELLLESLEATSGDEENPLERFEGSHSDKENSSSNSENSEGDNANVSTSGNRGILLNLISSYLMPAMKQVARFKRIYNQLYNEKMMHRQAYELVECMLSQLHKRMNRQKVSAFFETSNVIKTATKQGTIELVEQCIKTFPYLMKCDIDTVGQTMLQLAIAKRN